MSMRAESFSTESRVEETEEEGVGKKEEDDKDDEEEEDDEEEGGKEDDDEEAACSCSHTLMAHGFPRANPRTKHTRDPLIILLGRRSLKADWWKKRVPPPSRLRKPYFFSEFHIFTLACACSFDILGIVWFGRMRLKRRDHFATKPPVRIET